MKLYKRSECIDDRTLVIWWDANIAFSELELEGTPFEGYYPVVNIENMIDTTKPFVESTEKKQEILADIDKKGYSIQEINQLSKLSDNLEKPLKRLPIFSTLI